MHLLLCCFAFIVLLDFFFFFFFNDTATTEIYTLSLHDALPISARYPGFSLRMQTEVTGLLEESGRVVGVQVMTEAGPVTVRADLVVAARPAFPDRKSTRLNSSHDQISYAVFCLKKKKTKNKESEASTKENGKDRTVSHDDAHDQISTSTQVTH